MGRLVEGKGVFSDGVCSGISSVSGINSVDYSSVLRGGSDGRLRIGISKRGEGDDEILDGGQTEARGGQKEQRWKRTFRLEGK